MWTELFCMTSVCIRGGITVYYSNSILCSSAVKNPEVNNKLKIESYGVRNMYLAFCRRMGIIEEKFTSTLKKFMLKDTCTRMLKQLHIKSRSNAVHVITDYYKF